MLVWLLEQANVHGCIALDALTLYCSQKIKLKLIFQVEENKYSLRSEISVGNFVLA
jgi:hypothetical protein